MLLHGLGIIYIRLTIIGWSSVMVRIELPTLLKIEKGIKVFLSVNSYEKSKCSSLKKWADLFFSINSKPSPLKFNVKI